MTKFFLKFAKLFISYFQQMTIVSCDIYLRKWQFFLRTLVLSISTCAIFPTDGQTPLCLYFSVIVKSPCRFINHDPSLNDNSYLLLRTQCGNLIIFLPKRFYVKSLWANVENEKLSFPQFQCLWILIFGKFQWHSNGHNCNFS